MRRSLALALLTTALVGCEAYEPPPRLGAINLDKDVYDQRNGPLTLDFEQAIDTTSFRARLYLERTNVENDLCVPSDSGDLPEGCRAEARLIAGPCERAAERAFRPEDESMGIGFQCDGAQLFIAEDETRVSLSFESALIPFERYVLEIEQGLTGADGKRANQPLSIVFQAAGQFDLAPTDFEQGMFFTVFDVKEPVNAQFHFFFQLTVNHDTGEFTMFGADADPAREDVDPDTNRVPGDWITDPAEGTGATIAAQGQIAETKEGRVLAIFPFLLKVARPAIEARDTEVTGKFSSDVVQGGPSSERDVLRGSMFSPRVFLGADAERAELGSGSGQLMMFRLADDEVKPLESLLPEGLTLEEVFPGLGGN